MIIVSYVLMFLCFVGSCMALGRMFAITKSDNPFGTQGESGLIFALIIAITGFLAVALSAGMHKLLCAYDYEFLTSHCLLAFLLLGQIGYFKLGTKFPKGGDQAFVICSWFGFTFSIIAFILLIHE